MFIHPRLPVLVLGFLFLTLFTNPAHSQLLTPSNCYSNSVLPSTYQAWQEGNLWAGIAVSPQNPTQHVFLEIMEGENIANLQSYDPPVVSEAILGTNFAVKNFAGLQDTYIYPRLYSVPEGNLAYTVEYSEGLGALYPGSNETLQYGGSYWDCGLIRVFNVHLDEGLYYRFYLTTSETQDDLRLALLRESNLPDGWVTRSDAYFEKTADPVSNPTYNEFIPPESGSYALVVFLDNVTAFGGEFTVGFEEYIAPPDIPDLVVDSFSPSEAFEGATIPLVVTVSNIGGGVSQECVTQIMVDGSPICSDAYTPSIEVGEMVQVHCTLPALSIGFHQVEAIVDFGDVVVEGSETNNWGDHPLWIFAPELPNLRLTSVEPHTVVPNHPTQIYITVENVGSESAPASVTYLEDNDGTFSLTIPTPSLLRGDEVVVDATLPALSAGEYDVIVFADHGDLIQEAYEYDNDYGFLLVSQAPNLIVTAIGPPVVVGPGASEFEITVRNSGNASSISGYARFWIDSEIICDDIDTPGLSPGEETTVTCECPISLAAGTHEVLACVDVTDYSPESDETDNCLSGSVVVVPTSVVVRPDGSGDYVTIQAAIDAVAEDGEVLLLPGVYSGEGNRDLNFNGKNITVVSVADGMAVIDCQGNPDEPHRGFLFNSGETNEAKVRKIAITNGWVANSVGGGIFCSGSAPSIEDCLIYDCHADEGGAMAFSGDIPGGQRVIVNNCTMVSNYANLGGALHLGGTAGVEMSNTLIAQNSAYGGAVSVANSSSPTLELSCCDLWGNSGGDYTTAAGGQLGIRNNISQDPLFCDGAADDWHLASNSPCAEAVNGDCGRIGALPADCGPLGGTVRHVRADGSGEYLTIQHAINNCLSGDIVELDDGVYTGTGNREVNPLGLAIIIRSATGNPLACRIDGQDTYRGFNITNGEGPDTVILGIGIVNGAAATGAGIACIGSSPSLENLRIWDCDATDDGGGLHCEAYSSPRIVGCIFENNTATDDGGGIYAHDFSSPVISGSLFEGNLSGDRGGGADFVVNSFPEVTGCTFRGNEAPNGGGLIFVYAYGPVRDCVFVDNVATYGGAAQCYGNGQADFINCTMNGNQAAFGAQVYLRNNSSPDFESCILSFGLLGAAMDRYADDCNPTLLCTNIWANAYGDWTDFISDQLNVNGNFRADPLFCNVLAGDLTLRGDSPCAPAGNVDCGLIGALAVGCSGTWLVRPDGSGDFPTIQAAINAAAPAETIVLSDGVFTGPGNREIDFLGKAITVRSQSGDAELCIIDCQSSETNQHWGFQMVSGESASTVLENVTIRDGWRTYGAGGRIDDSSPILRGVVFSDCQGTDGGGLIVSNGNPLLEDCVFENNAVTDAGGGLYLNTSFPQIIRCIFRNNTAFWGGGGLYNQHAAPNLLECTFEGNSSDHWGGAVHNRYVDSAPHFTTCLFLDNTSPQGGAVYNRDETTPSFTSCTFIGNASENGAVLRSRTGSVTSIIRCLLVFSPEGAAVTSDDTGEVVVFCSDVYGNAGGDWTGPLSGLLGTNDNFTANPVFCDRYGGDFQLASVSPCQPANSPCGWAVGAFDLGCVLSGMEPEPVELPATLVLQGAVPNPFNPMTVISYSTPAAGQVEVAVFSLDGKRVATLQHGVLDAGPHKVTWQGKDKFDHSVASGVYIIRVKTDQEVRSKKIMLAR